MNVTLHLTSNKCVHFYIFTCQIRFSFVLHIRFCNCQELQNGSITFRRHQTWVCHFKQNNFIGRKQCYNAQNKEQKPFLIHLAQQMFVFWSQGQMQKRLFFILLPVPMIFTTNLFVGLRWNVKMTTPQSACSVWIVFPKENKGPNSAEFPRKSTSFHQTWASALCNCCCNWNGKVFKKAQNICTILSHCWTMSILHLPLDSNTTGILQFSLGKTHKSNHVHTRKEHENGMYECMCIMTKNTNDVPDDEFMRGKAEN